MTEVQKWLNKNHPKLERDHQIFKVLIRAIEENDIDLLMYLRNGWNDELLEREAMAKRWDSFLNALLVGEKSRDEDGIKLTLKVGVPSILNDKGENGDFKELIKRLSKLNIECTKRFGYFFGKKELKEQAQLEFQRKKYELEKTYLMITSYYESWNSEINPKNLYNFILSDDFKSHYHNFKQKETFWE